MDARTWLGLAGIIVAGAIGLFIFFILIDLAFYAWGALGTLLAIAVVLLLIAWIYDRRHADRLDEDY